MIGYYRKTNKVYVAFDCDNEGYATGVYKTYYKNGNIRKVAPVTKSRFNGVVKHYNPDGSLDEVVTFKDDKVLGVVENYENGRCVDVYYLENGKVVKEYKIKNGKRVPDAEEQFEIIGYRTGFVETYQNGGYWLIPRVIIKWSNTSSEEIIDAASSYAVFYNGKEKSCNERQILHLSYEPPIGVGDVFQENYDCSTVYKRFRDVTCKIYIDDVFIKEVKIQKKYLYSKRF